jgi:hypothetical protein
MINTMIYVASGALATSFLGNCKVTKGISWALMGVLVAMAYM